MMDNCAACGAAVPVQGSFCGQCGAPLARPSATGGNRWRIAAWMLGIAMIAAMGLIGWLVAENAADRHAMATVPAPGDAQEPPASPDTPVTSQEVEVDEKAEIVAPPAPVFRPVPEREASLAPIEPDGIAGESGEYIVFASIEDKRAGANDEAMQMLNRVYACRIHGSINHSSGFPGWRPGYVIVIAGPYRRTAKADEALARGRRCGLDGYRRAL